MVRPPLSLIFFSCDWWLSCNHHSLKDIPYVLECKFVQVGHGVTNDWRASYCAGSLSLNVSLKGRNNSGLHLRYITMSYTPHTHSTAWRKSDSCQHCIVTLHQQWIQERYHQTFLDDPADSCTWAGALLAYVIPLKVMIHGWSWATVNASTLLNGDVLRDWSPSGPVLWLCK